MKLTNHMHQTKCDPLTQSAALIAKNENKLNLSKALEEKLLLLLRDYVLFAVVGSFHFPLFEKG